MVVQGRVKTGMPLAVNGVFRQPGCRQCGAIDGFPDRQCRVAQRFFCTWCYFNPAGPVLLGFC